MAVYFAQMLVCTSVHTLDASLLAKVEHLILATMQLASRPNKGEFLDGHSQAIRVLRFLNGD